MILGSLIFRHPYFSSLSTHKSSLRMLPQEPFTCQGQVGVSFPAQCSVPAVLLAVSMYFRPFGAEVSAFKEKKLKLVNEKKSCRRIYFLNKLMNLDVVMGCNYRLYTSNGLWSFNNIRTDPEVIEKKVYQPRLYDVQDKKRLMKHLEKEAELAARVKLVDPGCPKTILFFITAIHSLYIYAYIRLTGNPFLYLDHPRVIFPNLFFGLGLPGTESVLLVPPENKCRHMHDIEKVPKIEE